MSKSISNARLQPDSVCNFIDKTYQILENKENQQIISWSAKGTSFTVKDVVAFSNSILPKYFKHSNFSSFVRQLNMYNFHKVRGDKLQNEFEHSKFRKDHRQLLSQIRRKGNEAAQNNSVSVQNTIKNLNQQKQLKTQQTKNIIVEKVSSQQNKPNQQFEKKYEVLLNQNKKLKKQKNKYLYLKKNILESDEIVQEKFYKFITSLLSLKIREKIYPDNKVKDPPFIPSFRYFNDIISHLISADKPSNYQFYENCCQILLKKCRDEKFMIEKNEPKQNICSLDNISIKEQQNEECQEQF